MTETRIRIAAPIRRVTASSGRMILHQLPEQAPQPVVEDSTVAIQTLDSIEAKLTQISNLIETRFAELGEQVALVASDVAKQVLRSDPELIQQRVVEFAQQTLQHPKAKTPATMHVHPECMETLEHWLAETGHGSIDLQADATLEPGDCRVEFDDKGLFASLDSLIEKITENQLADASTR
jgi:flagellar biosynthesis/type III secretory pathway protein FliH